MSRTLPLALVLLLAACRGGDENSMRAADIPTGGLVEEEAVVGTVQRLTPGDQWCQLTYADAEGQTQEAQAYNHLCERSDLVGQTVRLNFSTFASPAESCGDDPECRDLETLKVINTVLPLSDEPASPSEPAPSTPPAQP